MEPDPHCPVCRHDWGTHYPLGRGVTGCRVCLGPCELWTPR
jgi:hypothetical protein